MRLTLPEESPIIVELERNSGGKEVLLSRPLSPNEELGQRNKDNKQTRLNLAQRTGAVINFFCE